MRAVLPLIFAAICAGQTCRPDQIAPSTHCCDGAMGTLHGSIFLRNRSDTKCVLEKVPEVTLLDKSGRNIPVKVEPNSELNRFGAGSPRFVLQPGRSAAVFLATDPNFDENVCGTRMIVSIQGVIVRLKMPACGPRGERPTVSLSGFVDYSRVKPN